LFFYDDLTLIWNARRRSKGRRRGFAGESSPATARSIGVLLRGIDLKPTCAKHPPPSETAAEGIERMTMTTAQVLLLGVVVGISVGTSFAIAATVLMRFAATGKKPWQMTRTDYFTGQAMASLGGMVGEYDPHTFDPRAIARAARQIAEQADSDTLD
jgi:hypothetical protein